MVAAAVVDQGLDHRGVRRKVKTRVVSAVEECPVARRVDDINLEELDMLRDGIAPATQQVVNDGDVMPVGKREPHQIGALAPMNRQPPVTT